MTVILMIFCIASIAGCIVNISLMPVKMRVALCLLWGIGAGIIAMIMFGLPRQEIWTAKWIVYAVILASVDVIFFLRHIFSDRHLPRIAGLCPGFSILYPMIVLDCICTRSFPGADFATISILTGIAVVLLLAGSVAICRHLNAGFGTLYGITIVLTITSIILYGMT